MKHFDDTQARIFGIIMTAIAVLEFMIILLIWDKC